MASGKSSRQSPKFTSRRVYYVVSSHWDREWYQTFQDYRRRLVHLLDRALGDASNGFFKGPFTLDGQSILLEDYLEIRPDRRNDVERLLKSGKWTAGPWYVLPDEWLVSGESIIRNLELGRNLVRRMGGTPSDAGMVCDQFGHISQLPQIFGGFGIRGGFIWRGVEPRATAQILWIGADGTELPCYRFGRGGYCDYDFEVRHCTSHEPFDPTTALGDLKTFLLQEGERSAIPPILLFDGGDHLEYDDDHYRTLMRQASGEDFPYEIIHGTLDDYLQELLRQRKSIKHTVRGELRETGASPNHVDQQWLIPGVLSSRVWIKQANAECQTLLCQWAEPFAAMANAFLGVEYPHGYLNTAWKWLLQNHPHDSICGCSIDAVHEDMKYRFNQCRQIATAQTTESLRLLAAAVEGEVGEKQLRVLVANPLGREIDEPVDLMLQIPAEWGTYGEFFGFEPKPGFRIEDARGNEVPYQVLALAMDRINVGIRPKGFPDTFKTNNVTVCVRLQIPPLGYTTLTVREGDRAPKNKAGTAAMLPTRYPQQPALSTSERSMENEFLGVRIETNGTLTVKDKRTGEIYERLLTFEDCADIGDGWFHGPAVNDQRFVSSGTSSEIALVFDGASICQFRIRTSLFLPEEFDFNRGSRAEKLVPVVLDSRITLRAGSDRLEVETVVDNTVKDHRMRVLFPSGAKVETYFSDGAFDVLERPVALPKDNHRRREPVVETTPQQSWTAAAKGKRGLAVVSAGQYESAVLDWPERPIALTLFRATRKTFLTQGEPQGQSLEKMTFRYQIIPLAGGVDRRRLHEHGIQLAAGLRTAQLRTAEVALHRGKRRIPKTGSLFALKGKSIITSVRQVQKSLQVRFFNPETTRQSVSCQAVAWPEKVGKPTKAQPVNFEGKSARSPIALSSSSDFVIDPKKIMTLRLS